MTIAPPKAPAPARQPSPAPKPPPAKPRGHPYRTVGIVLLGLLTVAMAAGAWLLANPGLWRAYTDGRGIYVRDGDPNLRPVLWAPARPIEPANAEQINNLDGALSSRGTMLVFARKAAGADHSDLYQSRFDGASWSPPEPIIWVNTNADEVSPALSKDGRALFFCSDRKGGMGGLDIYVSWWDGSHWTQAYNLGSKVNSEFDELDPSASPAEDALYFASNRPKAGASPQQRKALWDKTVAQRKLGDLDIFVAEGVSIPSRENPLRDAAFRKALITQLGGSPETEAAVLSALRWLKANQEPDGHWDMAKHGGQKGQDIAGTALAVLSYLGWGAQHTEKGEFQESFYTALRWLKGQAAKYKGNFVAGAGQGMYGHAMATIALAESYAVSKEQTLREPLERAVRVILSAQNRETGGWRYQAKPPKTGDMSVSGWVVMALYSAHKAGIPVPDETLRLARRWMTRVTGPDGSYGYQSPQKITPAMTAEGMFARQLLGARRAEARQQQTARWLTGRLPQARSPDFYYWYYACLALYQQQGPQWTRWNNAIKPVLLGLQDKSGTWTDGRYKQFGRVGGSAMGALCLEVYYRYLWKLDQETDPVVVANQKLGRSPIEFPKEPAQLAARHVPELSSASMDRWPRFTRRGDFVYFSSDRPGGTGGMDVYRSRIVQDEFQPIENAGPRVNTPADDLSPSPACHGSLLLVASDRKAEARGGNGLYTQVARELATVTEGRGAWVAERWVLVSAIALGVLVILLASFVGWWRKTPGGPGVMWGLSYTWLVLMIGWLGLTLLVLAHPEQWLRYTDGRALEAQADDASVRRVIWERPLLLDTKANTKPSLLASATTARGRMLVFSRQLPTEQTADLHMMLFNGVKWSEPVPLDALNTESDEKSPALSKDGKVLLFQSNRPGGLGGSDLYVAWWDGKQWTHPENLGPSVNSPAHECDPGLSPDERSVYFASDRGGRGDKLDIFRADGVDLQPPPEKGTGSFSAKHPSGRRSREKVPAPFSAPTQPAPAGAVRVDALSSDSNDRSPAFTRHGDFVYVSSDRPGGLGGMDLYRARVQDRGFQPLANAGPLVNSPDDELSPAPNCHGFELVVTSDRVFNQRRAMLLYSQASWEVMAVVDWKALRWIERAKWWLLALLVGLLLLAGVLVWYFKWGRYGKMGGLARCILLSLILHGVLLVLLSLWMIGQVFQKTGVGPMDVAVDANALASERLAQDIRESVTEMPNTREMVYIPSDMPYQDLPDYEPVNPTARRIVESDFVIERTDVPTDVKRVEIAEKIELPKPSPVASKKPSLRFQPTDLELEEPPRDAKQAPKPAEAVEVGIAPVKTTERVSESAETIRTRGKGPRKQPSKMAEAGLPEATGSEDVTVAKARPPARAVPKLRGPGEVLSKRIPPLPIGPEVRLGGTGEGTGRGDGSARLDPYIGRENRLAMARIGGGGDDTERAIARALEWLKRNQEPDGSWSLEKHGGEKGHDNAATGFAMLCYFGWNIKHTEKDKYGYQEVIKKAVKWMVGRVGEDGDLTGGTPNGMYDQGIATMALAEAYGLTKDPALRKPLERAVKFILKAQSPRLGGWRYRPTSRDNDTSVFGWQVMALVSARMAGIEVPERNFQLAGAWLDSVASGPHKGRYSYQSNRGPTATMTAEAMFCQQLMGVPRTDNRQAGSADYLKNHMPNPRNPSYYYWYYACLALHQHQGPVWQEWNAKVKPILLSTQILKGPDAGAWPVKGQWTRGRGGKIMSTAMSALSLEVYYRYLPMYDLPERKP